MRKASGLLVAVALLMPIGIMGGGSGRRRQQGSDVQDVAAAQTYNPASAAAQLEEAR